MINEGTQTELTKPDNKNLMRRIIRKLNSEDPFFIGKCFEVPKHPLWTISINNLWKSVSEKDSMIGYST